MFILCLVLTAFWALLIVRVIFSWIPRPPEPLEPVANAARVATDWAVQPLRGMIPPIRTGAVAFDVSILVVFFAVAIVRGLVC